MSVQLSPTHDLERRMGCLFDWDQIRYAGSWASEEKLMWVSFAQTEFIRTAVDLHHTLRQDHDNHVATHGLVAHLWIVFW